MTYTTLAMAGSIAIMLAISGCGQLTSSATDTSDNTNALSKADAAFSQIKDEDSASTALNQLLSIADTRTGSKSVGFQSLTTSNLPPAISDELKSKLVALELQFRTKKTTSIRSIEGHSDPEIQALINKIEDHASQGMSPVQIADALNNAIRDSSIQLASIGVKAVEMADPFTANDVEIIRQKTLTLLPNSGNPTSGISPLEALVIGYVAASDDDGQKPDGAVKLYATDDMQARFIEEIVASQEGVQP
jgi:hypothetical protein